MVHYDPQYADLVEALTSGNYAAATVLGFFIDVSLGPRPHRAVMNGGVTG